MTLLEQRAATRTGVSDQGRPSAQFLLIFPKGFVIDLGHVLHDRARSHLLLLRLGRKDKGAIGAQYSLLERLDFCCERSVSVDVPIVAAWPDWILPRWLRRHRGASVVTALDAVATEGIPKCRITKRPLRLTVQAREAA